MKKVSVLFLFCISIFMGINTLCAATVSIIGKRTSAQTNAPRITIGSYIKSRGFTSVKSGPGGSKPVPSTVANDADIKEINSDIGGLQSQVGDFTTEINGLETRVENVENQTDTLSSQMSSVTAEIADTIYKKDEINNFLQGKQNTLPGGAVTGQILTQGTNGLEWKTSEATGDVYTKTEVDTRLDTKQNNLPTGAESGQVLSYDSGGLQWKTLSSPPGTLPVVSEPGLYIISVWSGGDYYLQKVELTEDYYTN